MKDIETSNIGKHINVDNSIDLIQITSQTDRGQDTKPVPIPVPHTTDILSKQQKSTSTYQQKFSKFYQKPQYK